MYRLKKLLCAWFLCLTTSICFAQTGFENVLQDDPIAAALDSLHKINLFEKGITKSPYIKNPKYNFAADSIPK